MIEDRFERNVLKLLMEIRDRLSPLERAPSEDSDPEAAERRMAAKLRVNEAEVAYVQAKEDLAIALKRLQETQQ